VDIGSSSVARGVVGLVLGYITSVVVDLAVLIEVINFYFIIIFWLHIQMFLEGCQPHGKSWDFIYN
jgi:hypothetical protein